MKFLFGIVAAVILVFFLALCYNLGNAASEGATGAINGIEVQEVRIVGE